MDGIQSLWTRSKEMLNGLIDIIPNLILAFIVFILFVFLARGIRNFVRHLTQNRRHARNLGLVLGRLAQGITLLVGLFIALSIVIPTFQAGDLVQLLGISGVAIGFAFRDILQNFLAGILILLTEPFQINDQIIFKDFEGTVENIQTRATLLRTYDGRRIVIPNSELFTNSVLVNTAFENRRLQYDIGIGYGDDILLAKQLILEAMSEISSVLQDPAPDAIVIGLEESVINIRARWWIHPPRRADALALQDQVLTAIKIKLTENGIDLPFPTQQILFHDQTEETDGDRTRQREGWPAGRKQVPKSRSISHSLQQLILLRRGQSDHHGDHGNGDSQS